MRMRLGTYSKRFVRLWLTPYLTSPMKYKIVYTVYVCYTAKIIGSLNVESETSEVHKTEGIQLERVFSANALKSETLCFSEAMN